MLAHVAAVEEFGAGLHHLDVVVLGEVGQQRAHVGKGMLVVPAELLVDQLPEDIALDAVGELGAAPLLVDGRVRHLDLRLHSAFRQAFVSTSSQSLPLRNSAS